MNILEQIVKVQLGAESNVRACQTSWLAVNNCLYRF